MRVVGTAVIARAYLLKFIFSIDLSNCYNNNHVIMYTYDCQFHLNRAIWHLSSFSTQNHTGQCKRTGGCYNELVVAFFSTGGGVKGKKIYTC